MLLRVLKNVCTLLKQHSVVVEADVLFWVAMSNKALNNDKASSISFRRCQQEAKYSFPTINLNF